MIIIHKINANWSGFIEILLRAFLSICEPIQNKPSNKKHWLVSFMKLMVWELKSINKPIAIDASVETDYIAKIARRMPIENFIF